MKRTQKMLFIALLPLLAVVFVAFRSPKVAAASYNYTNFPMEDSVMRASGTMTAQQIQDFLAQQGSGLSVFQDVENCGSPAGSHYAFYSTYYHCGNTMSAAQIIYDAGQAYGINPQVLLATMQKEQSLITTPNPTASQLNYAMGYGCPDSGGCGYAGFFNQLDNASWQFRTDMELGGGNNWWGYTPASYPCNGATRYYSAALKTGNNVTFYDDQGTGYTNFVIPNMATGTLYCYTPHVYPGSAQQYYSGNYWFVYYFNRWFVPYSWQWNSQYAYTDATKTTPKSLNGIMPGDRVYVGFTAKNTGNQTWSKTGANPVSVGTVAPQERTSIFADNSWLSPTRPVLLKEATVAPGQIGTFEFWLTIPNSPGGYNERFSLVANGLTWFNDIGLSYGIGIAPRVYSWQWAGQYAYTDSNKTTAKSLNGLLPGDRVYVGFRAKNTGNQTWSNTGANPVRVGTSNPLERASIFADNSWIGPSRPTVLKESSVAPGATGTFEFWMTVPNNPGSYDERFNLVSEGRSWFSDIGLSYGISVNPRVYSWQWAGQYAYTDSNKTTPIDLNTLHPGQQAYVGFRAKNTGNQTWSNTGANPVRVGTMNPLERASPFAPGSSWIGPSRPVAMTESSVAPGATGTFEFWMTAPSALGTYNERFGLLAEGRTWFNDVGLSYGARVQ